MSLIGREIYESVSLLRVLERTETARWPCGTEPGDDARLLTVPGFDEHEDVAAPR